MKLPDKPLDDAVLFDRLDTYRRQDLDWRSGKSWGYVFDAGRRVEEVAKRAHAEFQLENYLDPTVYPSLLRMENEIVAILLDHLNGGEDAAGTFTSGGTESIMLAIKTARDFARATRPEVTAPEIVVPITAHAAFHKAGHYLGVKVVSAPVDPSTFRADVDAMAAAITDQTILLVGSAPSYAHGVIDPIEALGALALERGLLLHVDACVGGWLLPYFRRLGDDVPPFDLAVPGVTSLSVDLHKYGYVPKGASVVLYTSAAYRRHQMYVCSTWTGYSVVNPTVQSSRSGGPLAAAWAVLHALGDEGYLELTRDLRDASRALIDGIDAIDGLRVLGSPDMSLFAFAADDASVFHLVDEMKERGWYVQPQLAYDSSPENVHLTVSPGNVPQVEAFLRDLQDSLDAARELPPAEVPPELLTQLQSLLASGEADLTQLLAVVGVQPGRLPERRALVNAVLNVLPSEVTEPLLADFVNTLFRLQEEPALAAV